MHESLSLALHGEHNVILRIKFMMSIVGLHFLDYVSE